MHAERTYMKTYEIFVELAEQVLRKTERPVRWAGLTGIHSGF